MSLKKLYTDVELSSYRLDNHKPLQGLPLSQVADEITDFEGDITELNNLKTNLFDSLVDATTYHTSVGAYRALQLLHMLGADSIVKQMFGSDTEPLSRVTIPSSVSLYDLGEKDGFYEQLYERAKKLLTKSSYFNPNQSHLHSNLSVIGCGCTNLLKLITLLFLYMDIN